MFFRLGAIKFSESLPNLTQLTDVCTYDATMYMDNSPKRCMIRKQETSFRPHLVRHLNLLDNELPDIRTYIQDMWDSSNDYIQQLNVTPYQSFFIISANKWSVSKHSHGDHMGDTVTVVSTLGDTISDGYLFFGDNVKLKYPDPNQGRFAVCFDSNIIHHTEINDYNYYFHFVYDLVTKYDGEKNILRKIS
jgi:hypothetical protein